MLNSATAHTANFSAALEDVFGKRLITLGLWQEVTQYSKKNLQYFRRALSCHVSRSIFSRCDDCLEAGGQHFEALL
jgi:hypothetical protein